ncbi:MAG: hypothetical protein ABSF46_31110 [Terriglobia bacterium]|jgi:hypothetical protein
MIGVLLRAIGFLLAGNPASERPEQLSDGNFMQPCRKITLHPGAGQALREETARALERRSQRIGQSMKKYEGTSQK